jgi:hypothetical protein
MTGRILLGVAVALAVLAAAGALTVMPGLAT